MPPNNPNKPDIDRDGRFKDTGTGLMVPRTYQANQTAAVISTLGSAAMAKGFNEGTTLPRDPSTLAVRWARKGSGLDDIASEAIVDGTIANVGLSPVIAPQISAMVRRQQSQAITASVEITGRKTPFNKAADGISRFNDSPLGVTDALEIMTYRLCTYNRGAPIATVPITYSFDQWAALGLEAVPILAEGEKEEAANRYYLTVDWGKHGTPIPYLPKPFDLEPTGNPEFPYWYRTMRDERPVWVLLHQSQIIEVLPGKSAMPGVGNSAVWMCLGFLAEQIMITEERSEKMLYTMTDGIHLLGGVNISGDQIEDKVRTGRTAAMERGYEVAKGSTIITSPLDKVSYVSINFRQPPGMEFKEWREYAEDIIAFCFGEPLSTMVIRGGVGFGAQADTAADNAAESGVGALLQKVATALGAIYPRVQISIARPNDRAQRLNVETLATFSNAAAVLIDRKVITAAQAAVMIDRDILPIPQDDTLSAGVNSDDDADEERETAAGGSSDADTVKEDDKADADSALQALYEVLYEDADVTIEDTDEERALEKARDRVDQDLFDLLNAEPVEE